jgi:hypothetical protein
MAIKKLQAATLVETLTAATILSIVAGLGMMLFLRLSSPSSNGGFLLAAEQQSYALFEAGVFCTEEERRDLETQHLSFSGVWSQRSEHIKQFQVEVYDVQGNILYTRKRLYYAP